VLTCAQAVTGLLADTCRWEVRSAAAGSEGQRWYAWAWLATASPRHCLLIRCHLATGELAFHPARARWDHQRTRLVRDAEMALVS
jgi:hypothetical protein